jgi:hypothetical protein
VLIYVLFHETNSGKFDESDGYVEAVYVDEATAERARLATIRAARDKGLSIWWDPDRPDEDGPSNWEHDWRIEVHQVTDTDEAIVQP